MKIKLFLLCLLMMASHFSYSQSGNVADSKTMTNCPDASLLKGKTLMDVSDIFDDIYNSYLGGEFPGFSKNDFGTCWYNALKKIKAFSDFDIPQEMVENDPFLIYLVYNSKSLASFDEKQNWFNLYPIMNDEQTARLYEILTNEAIKLKEIEDKYNRKRDSIQDYFSLHDFDKYSYSLGYFIDNGKVVLDYWTLKDGKYFALSKNITSKTVIFITSFNKDEFSSKYGITLGNYTLYDDSLALEALVSLSPSDLYKMNELEVSFYKYFWKYYLDELDLFDRDDFASLEVLSSLPFEDFESNSELSNDMRLDRLFVLRCVHMENSQFRDAANAHYDYLLHKKDLPLPFLYHYSNIVFPMHDESKIISKEIEKFLVAKFSGYKNSSINFYFKNNDVDVDLMLIDYLIATTDNIDYRVILLNIRGVLYECIKNEAVQLGSEDWENVWYKYFNEQYLSGSFDRKKSIVDISNEVEEFSIRNSVPKLSVIPCKVEYLCYYALINYAKDNTFDVKSYMQECITLCRKSEKANMYLEKYIAQSFVDNVYSNSYEMDISIVGDELMMNEPWDDIDFSSVRNLSFFPPFDEEDSIVTYHPFLDIRGHVSVESSVVFFGIVKAKVNPKGNFNEPVSLKPGINKIEVKCVAPNGMIETRTLVVNYKKDTYYDRKDKALFIAVQDYDDPEYNLKYPINEAKDLAEQFAKYGFDTNVVENPTFDDFKKILREYHDYYNEDTNRYNQLFVLLAGHGSYDDLLGGFFRFKDKEESFANMNLWFDNLKCSHIFLLVDACHSGSFFIDNWSMARGGDTDTDLLRELYKNKNAQYKSRFCITSGSKDDRVPDKSLVVEKLLNLLRREREIITFDDISQAVRTVKEPKPVIGTFLGHQPQGTFLLDRKRE